MMTTARSKGLPIKFGPLMLLNWILKVVTNILLPVSVSILLTISWFDFKTHNQLEQLAVHISRPRV